MNWKLLYWIPRIFTILLILFMVMFSIDCFEVIEYNLRQKFICFLMHNIPAFIITVILLIAWKWESTGGMVLVVASLAMGVIFNGFTSNFGILIIIAPLVVCGVLFVIHSIKAKSVETDDES